MSRQAAHSRMLGDNCADVDADHCLPPEQQEVYDGIPGRSPSAAESRATHSAAYRLDEDRRLAEALQHLQTFTGQEAPAGDASNAEADALGALPCA